MIQRYVTYTVNLALCNSKEALEFSRFHARSGNACALQGESSIIAVHSKQPYWIAACLAEKCICSHS
jgi:hypothetical protein